MYLVIPAFVGVNWFLTLLEANDLERTLISEYALHDYGYLFSWSLIILSLSSAGFTRVLQMTFEPGNSRLSGWNLCLYIWNFGSLLAGIFPTDRGGFLLTPFGGLHVFGASLSFVGFVLGSHWFVYRYRAYFVQTGVWEVLRGLTWVVGLGILFVFLPDGVKGLGEKLFILGILCWQLFMGWWLQTKTQSRLGVGEVIAS